jgi:hypothetical protein
MAPFRRKKTILGKEIIDLMPKNAEVLLGSSGREMIRQVGLDVIRGVVLDVLSGRNLRDSTEMLTRKRIASLNAATLVMFIKGQTLSEKFIERLTVESCHGLLGQHRKEHRWILQWILGLNDKAYQNVLRDRPDLLADYTDRLTQVYKQVSALSEEDYGSLSGELVLSDNLKAQLDWSFILHLFGMIGAQTLAIRGSEKSTYGKLFERLILGALLHILGFELINPKKPVKSTRVFWLASREERRESDATALFEAGKGVRFDIGFIGRGNPEISLDKVTRFEREIQFGRGHWYMATIIIVDRIGAKSRIPELAKRVGGKVVQMSLAYWPKQVAQILAQTVGLKHPLAKMPDSNVGEYLKRQLAVVPLESFVPSGKVNSNRA